MGGEVGKTDRFAGFLLEIPHVPPLTISFCILLLLRFLWFFWIGEEKKKSQGGRQNCPFCRVSAKISTRTPPLNFFLYLATVVSGLEEKRKNETEGGKVGKTHISTKIDVFLKEGDQTYISIGQRRSLFCISMSKNVTKNEK